MPEEKNVDAEVSQDKPLIDQEDQNAVGISGADLALVSRGAVQSVMQETVQMMPAVKAISERVQESLNLSKRIEDSIGKLLEDETYAKDSAFLLSSKSTIDAGIAKLMASSKGYIDSLSRFAALIAATKSPREPEEKDNKVPADQTVSPEEIAASAGNGSFSV